MAKVQYGGGITDMRGKVSGMIFSTWRGIGTVRKFTRPVLRRQTTQPLIRSYLGWLSRHYGTLSEADRTLWDTWADEHPGIDAFGDPFTMTGLNAYVSLNLIAARLGGHTAISDSPPLANLDQTIVGFAVSTGTNPGEIDLEWGLPNGGLAADYVEAKLIGPLASPALVKTVPEMAFDSKVDGNLLINTITGLVEEGWYWAACRYVGEDGQVANWHVGQSQPQPTP